MTTSSLAQTKNHFNVQEIESAKGIKAWLLEEHSVPNLTLYFKMRGGSAYDPKDKEGLALFTSAMLDQGAGDLPYKAFQQKLEELAGEIDFGANEDHFYGTLKTIKANLMPMANLFRDCLHTPRMDEVDFERTRGQMLIALKSIRENPFKRAKEQLLRILFKGHPYEKSSYGTEKSLKSITRADARAYLKNALAKETLMIGIAGDITPDEAKKLIDILFDDFQEKAVFKALEKFTPKDDGKVHQETDKKLSQTTTFFGHATLKRNDPDYYAAQVLNDILGGGTFSDRLMKEVRAKRGLTYSISTMVDHRQAASLLIGAAATENDRFKETVTVIRDVWTDLAKNGPTDAEIEHSKRHITGAYDLYFDNTKTIASILVTLQEYGLGRDHLNKRNDYIKAVKRADIMRVMDRTLKPKDLTFGSFGNAKS